MMQYYTQKTNKLQCKSLKDALLQLLFFNISTLVLVQGLENFLPL